jgi:hypothetical protein
MRIDNENMELMLFDLLEGNLDAETESKVREEIAHNPVWEREWKLMQMTVLTPETNIVFEKKQTLLKPIQTRKIVPIYWRWIAVSAAACLIFFIWFGTQNQSKNSLPDIATVKPIKPNLNKVESNQTDKTNSSNSELQIPESVNDPITKKAKENIVPFKEPETIAENPLPEEPLFRKETEPITGLSFSKPEFDKMSHTPDLPKIPNTIQVHPTNMPEAPEPDKGLKNLLAIGMSRLDPYRNPKIKLAAGRSDNKPVLMFTLNTNSYHAAAVVQLKTNE